MTDDGSEGLPEVGEPKFGPERLVYEKEVNFSDFRALLILLASGVICGIMMWVAFSFVGGSIDLKALFGAVIGGLVSGGAIYALTG